MSFAITAELTFKFEYACESSDDDDEEEWEGLLDAPMSPIVELVLLLVIGSIAVGFRSPCES